MPSRAPRPDGTEGFTIEGLAIVSADGMIADRGGVQPDALKLEADQRFFRNSLQMADILVHGRNSGEGGSPAAQRRRIVLTRRVPGVARDREDEKLVLWNPSGATLGEACAPFGMPAARLAVIGGTDVFGLFLEFGYDVFHLSRAGQARLPGGRPVFPGVPDRSPEDLLSGHGLKPGGTRILDPSAGLTLVTWKPQA